MTTDHPACRRHPAGLAFVAGQFVMLIWIASPYRPLVHPWTGATIGIAATVFGLWAVLHNRPGNFNIRPEVRLGARLVVSGPYRHVRHPMYASFLLGCLGLAVAYHSWDKYLAFALLAVVMHGKAAFEEQRLVHMFPDYNDYRRRTGRFLPGRRP